MNFKQFQLNIKATLDETGISSKKKQTYRGFIKVYNKFAELNEITPDTNFTDVLQLTQKMYDDKLSILASSTIARYLRDLEASMKIDIVKNNVPEDIIQNVKVICDKYIREADRQVNVTRKTPKKKDTSTPVASTIVSDDLNDIEIGDNIGDEIVIEDYNDVQNNMKLEISLLRDKLQFYEKQIDWLQKMLELAITR